MKNKSVLFIALALCLLSLNLSAQGKIGFVDETYIAQNLPEYATIQQEMKAYQDKAQAEIKALEDEYTKKIQEVEALDPEVTPGPIVQSRLKEIQDLEKQIQELQNLANQEYQGMLSQKLKPVYDKMSKAIEEVALAQGNIYIFRIESLLYKQDKNNLSNLVLKQMGVTPTPNPELDTSTWGSPTASNKIGVADINYILPKLPAFTDAQKVMKVYTDKLQESVQKIQAEYQEIERRGGQMTPETPKAQRDQLVSELKAKQEELLKAQQNAQEQMSKKQNTLMEPIEKDVMEKIKEVSEAQGYTYILRIEASFYEPAENNISDSILRKMGVDPIADSGSDTGN